ncbi:RNA polymerase sigma factor [Polyangium mundeleinium]|uniref:Sigma-70 family RNA polymerase sigma factor n=1 Tax=Polyangium mundeleinium TaxID=2995306 RepID=A0ABT5EL44_9BACT|nr:sigma-70 family RNA polymerase sigma factor [Polyangium mundeleinium]MDC0742568.1 sigma-70 family RNA polymerase sigma factor [Polyangium mundeleinium]
MQAQHRPTARPTTSTDVVISAEDFAHYITQMRSVARRLGANRAHVADLVNDAFLVACSKPKSKRPDPADREGMSKWLCSIVKNITLRHLRKQRNAPDIVFDQEALENAPDPSGTAFVLEEHARLAIVFGELDDARRHLILEHVIHDQGIRDIAVEQAMAPSTVFSRISKALRSMRKRLVRMDEMRPGRRPPFALVPFLLIALFARDARARLGAAWQRLARMALRAPTRALLGTGAAALVLASTPSPNPHAMPGAPPARACASAARPLPPDHDGEAVAIPRVSALLRETPPLPRRAPDVHLNRGMPAPRKGRSALALYAENATKSVTPTAPGAALSRPEPRVRP